MFLFQSAISESIVTLSSDLFLVGSMAMAVIWFDHGRNDLVVRFRVPDGEEDYLIVFPTRYLERERWEGVDEVDW
jgi:hypothetical protein